MVLTPSKITIEHNETGDKTFPQNVPINDPEYISSPIKWNFACDGEGSANKTEYVEVATQPSTSSSKYDGNHRQSDVKTVSIWRTDNEESNAIIFHHESEIVENCCENYFNCNYQHDDQQQQMRTQFHEAFTASNHEVPKSTERLNNTVEIVSSHSAPLDILNRNNISSVINQLNLSPEFRHYEKTTNLSQQTSVNLTPCRSSRTNQNFNLLNQNMENNNFSEDKFINTSRNTTNELNAHHNVAQSSNPPSSSSGMLRNLELFNISTPSTSHRGKPIGINLTTQNQFPTSSNHSRSLSSSNFTAGQHSSSLSDVSFEPSPEETNRWQQVTNTVGLSGLAKIVRKRARKFVKGDNSYSDYLRYFDNELEAKGLKNTFDLYFSQLMSESLGAALHPLINIGYAMEFKNPILLSEGLAYVCITPLRDASKILNDADAIRASSDATIFQLIEELQSIKFPEINNDDWNFQKKTEFLLENYGMVFRDLIAKWDLTQGDKLLDKLNELTEASILAVFGTYPKQIDFFLLHGLTGNHAVRILFQNLPEALQRQILKVNLLGFLTDYVVQRCPKVDINFITGYEESNLGENNPTWDVILEKTISIDEVHVPKVIRCLTHYMETVPLPQRTKLFTDTFLMQCATKVVDLIREEEDFLF
ncbi:hypothetical protein HA402_004516 [Bradysia odoriphaga]|nr:hypothetical protein HA402_004516 [Bradysia odoriphaga]